MEGDGTCCRWRGRIDDVVESADVSVKDCVTYDMAG
jgi:hypothetical protein